MGEMLGQSCSVQNDGPHTHTEVREERRGQKHLLQESKPVCNFVECEIGIFPLVNLSSFLSALKAKRTPMSWSQHQERPSACILHPKPTFLFPD